MMINNIVNNIIHIVELVYRALSKYSQIIQIDKR